LIPEKINYRLHYRVSKTKAVEVCKLEYIPFCYRCFEYILVADRTQLPRAAIEQIPLIETATIPATAIRRQFRDRFNEWAISNAAARTPASQFIFLRWLKDPTIDSGNDKLIADDCVLAYGDELVQSMIGFEPFVSILSSRVQAALI